MSESEMNKAIGRALNGVMDVFGPSAQRKFEEMARPIVERFDRSMDDKARDDLDGKLRQSFQELEKTEQLYKDQDREFSELIASDDFQKADAIAKEQQAKKLIAGQEQAKEQFFKEQEARDQEIFKDLERQRGVLDDRQELARSDLASDIANERAQEIAAREAVLEQRRQETEVAKPDFADVERAEATRRDLEMKQLSEDQEKQQADALKNMERQGRDPAEVAEAMRRQQEIFEKQQEDLRREQEERMQRFAKLYDRDR